MRIFPSSGWCQIQSIQFKGFFWCIPLLLLRYIKIPSLNIFSPTENVIKTKKKTQHSWKTQTWAWGYMLGSQRPNFYEGDFCWCISCFVKIPSPNHFLRKMSQKNKKKHNIHGKLLAKSPNMANMGYMLGAQRPNFYKRVYISKNRGTPKSSILIGFCIINHPFRGTPIFGNTQNMSGLTPLPLFLPLENSPMNWDWSGQVSMAKPSCDR